MLKSILKFQILFLLALITTANSQDSNEKITATFSDWLKVCNIKNQKCVGVTFAESESGNRIGRFVLDLSKMNTSKIKAVGTLLIPYESAIPHLTSGVSMQLDQHPAIKENYFFCDKSGCNVRFQFTSVGLELIKSGSNILIKFKDVRKLNVVKTMDISLKGIIPVLSSLE